MCASLTYVNAISDKYISSSVDCGDWNGYFGAALSLIDVNELLRSANYKPADCGRTQKKTVILPFFSSAPYPTFAKTVAATLDDRLYIYIHRHAEAVHIRCMYVPGYVSGMSLLVHESPCVFRLCGIVRIVPSPSRFIPLGKFRRWPLYNPTAAAAVDLYTRSCT